MKWKVFSKEYYSVIFFWSPKWVLMQLYWCKKHTIYSLFQELDKNCLFCCLSLINSLWPSDAIWRHRSGSSLTQVMPCCQMAWHNYQNQCWLIVSEFLWHLPEGSFTGNLQFKFTAASPRSQWVNLRLTMWNKTCHKPLVAFCEEISHRVITVLK